MPRTFLAVAVAAAVVGSGPVAAQTMDGTIFNHANRAMTVTAPDWGPPVEMLAGTSIKANVRDNTSLPITFIVNNNIVCVATLTPNVNATTKMMDCQYQVQASGTVIQCGVQVFDNNTPRCTMEVHLNE